MSKEIDQLSDETAMKIFKWLVRGDLEQTTLLAIKTASRNYLRHNGLTLEQAAAAIRRETAGMPVRIF